MVICTSTDTVQQCDENNSKYSTHLPGLAYFMVLFTPPHQVVSHCLNMDKPMCPLEVYYRRALSCMIWAWRRKLLTLNGHSDMLDWYILYHTCDASENVRSSI